MAHFKYIALSGGGAAGIAYAGAFKALSTLSPDQFSVDELKGVSGTSVGAIAALLLCLRYSPDEISKHLEGLNLRTLADLSGRHTTTYRLLTSYGKYDGKTVYEHLLKVIHHKMKDFTIKPPEEITFNDLKRYGFIDLYVVACKMQEVNGIPKGSKKIFSYNTTPDTPIAAAVRASANAPFYFKACRLKKISKTKYVLSDTGDWFTDGGLVENFPIGMFDHPDYLEESEKHQISNILNPHTLGLVLLTKEEMGKEFAQVKVPIPNRAPYKAFKAILNTLMRNSDRDNLLRTENAHRILKIDRLNVSLGDFDMNDETKQLLIRSGYECVIKYFKNEIWKKPNFPRRIINPQEVSIDSPYSFRRPSQVATNVRKNENLGSNYEIDNSQARRGRRPSIGLQIKDGHGNKLYEVTATVNPDDPVASEVVATPQLQHDLNAYRLTSPSLVNNNDTSNNSSTSDQPSGYAQEEEIELQELNEEQRIEQLKEAKRRNSILEQKIQSELREAVRRNSIIEQQLQAEARLVKEKHSEELSKKVEDKLQARKKSIDESAMPQNEDVNTIQLENSPETPASPKGDRNVFTDKIVERSTSRNKNASHYKKKSIEERFQLQQPPTPRTKVFPDSTINIRSPHQSPLLINSPLIRQREHLHQHTPLSPGFGALMSPAKTPQVEDINTPEFLSMMARHSDIGGKSSGSGSNSQPSVSSESEYDKEDEYQTSCSLM